MHRLFVVLVFAFMATSLRDVRAEAYAHFEARHTHPIELTPDRTKLLVVNSPDARLSVFELPSGTGKQPVLVAEIPVGLEPVSVRARTETEAWVVNEVSDSVSVVSLVTGTTVATLPCDDEPADVVFAADRAFVSCARNQRVRVFDVGTLVEVAVIPVAGVSPRFLTVDRDRAEVLVGFHHSGNGTTSLPASLAPHPPEPTNDLIPVPPQTALIVPASDPRVRYRVEDLDVARISAVENRVLDYRSGVGTILFDLALRPGTRELWVGNTEARNLVRFEPDLRGHVADHRLSAFEWSAESVRVMDLNPRMDYAKLPDPKGWATALAQPAALAFSEDGSELWVAALGSDRVARVRCATGAVDARVDLRPATDPAAGTDSRRMRGPCGLAWHWGEQQLYVFNKCAQTVSVVDTTGGTLRAEFPVGSHDPVPGDVKAGRGFIFDARRSGNGTVSCATCHVDADRDGLAWDLGNPGGEMALVTGANLAVHDPSPVSRSMHPMKGPMVTQTLRGLAPGQRLHWRGDRASLADFNATFRDLMGGELVQNADIEAMQSYLGSLKHHPNPNRKLDNTLPTEFRGGNPNVGRSLFNAHVHHCGVCHIPPTGSDNNVDDPRNVGGTQPMKTPPLQTVYQRALLDTRSGAVNATGFGLGHDGTGGSQQLPTVHFYELDLLSGQAFADVAAFVMCFDTGVAAVVGRSLTITAGSLTNADTVKFLDLLESQASAVGVCDLVVRGREAGIARGYVFDPISRAYLGGSAAAGLRTRGSLIQGLGSGDALTFLAVLPGAGMRFGRDRDGDGILDDEEERPALGAKAVSGSVTVSWPEECRDWLLESLLGSETRWRAVLDARSISGGRFSTRVTTSLNTAEFFRLRRVW